MFARLLLVIAVFAALVAFAPAPLPRRARVTNEGISLERLQGVWVVQKVETSLNKGYRPSSDDLAEVRIDGKSWTFVNGRRSGKLRVGPSMNLTVDGTKSPAWFDLTGGSTTTGILRIRGGELQVLYKWGGARPTSIDVPPDGYWFITFKRR